MKSGRLSTKSQNQDQKREDEEEITEEKRFFIKKIEDLKENLNETQVKDPTQKLKKDEVEETKLLTQSGIGEQGETDQE